MARRKPARAAHRELVEPFADVRAEPGPDGSAYLVRAVSGSRAGKTYRCPGCDQEIRPGTGHVVAWPDRGDAGIRDRRHWHVGCWSGRATRGITRRWS
ncbi:hypothetical protein [Skermania piniformis]|uniref:ATP/GTP-binding protein n=1 Tax=Skermania pinensis TaxID=39122 RepID=A0ABX8SBR9_9ACTN|nr:hypothetical protein [Skermania piniformis]QXQ14766.1 hypothetical protein KV203_05095 [Skermania piniformis]